MLPKSLLLGVLLLIAIIMITGRATTANDKNDPSRHYRITAGDPKQTSNEIISPPASAEHSESDSNKKGQITAEGGSEKGASDLKRLPEWPAPIQKTALGIDGTWTGLAPKQGGGVEHVTYTFKVDGTTLKGTVRGILPSKGYTTTRLEGGRVAGNNFSFAYGGDLYGVGVPITFIFHGIFLGDKIQLSYVYKGGGYGFDNVYIPPYKGTIPQTFIVKRVK